MPFPAWAFLSFLPTVFLLTRDSREARSCAEAWNRYSPHGLGRHPKPCSSDDPPSTCGHVRRLISAGKGCRTSVQGLIRAALAIPVDFGARFSPQLSPLHGPLAS